MHATRPAALAGSWYPADPAALASLVDGFLAGEPRAGAPAGRAWLGLAPHAGYTYSGAVAGLLFGALPDRPPRRLVILAPNHREPLDRPALSGAGAFATPLGDVAVDTACVSRLAAGGAFTIDDRAHRQEHAVEIQLPLAQRRWPGACPAIVPALVPRLDDARRAAAARALAAELDDATFILVSTDLTHHGEAYGFTPFAGAPAAGLADAIERLDAGALLRVLAGDADGLLEYGRRTGVTMCGLEAAALALGCGVPAGHQAALLGYARSGDRDGDYALSVSYAAALLATGGDHRLDERERAFLRALAAAAVAAAARGLPLPDPAAFAAERGLPLAGRLLERRGAFVTLHSGRDLRGCIGVIEGRLPLADAVVRNAAAAAVDDPRFPPVSPDEVSNLSLEVSALTPLRAVAGPQDIVVGRHGILLGKSGRQAVFLPQVATEQGWDLPTTLAHLCRKAGLPTDAWREGARLSVFEAEVF